MDLVNKVKETLKQVKDPELKLDVVFLGLIREIVVGEGEIFVLMTLTSPACPMASVLVEQVKKTVQSVAEEKEVRVELTFDPPWNPPEEVKELFGWS